MAIAGEKYFSRLEIDFCPQPRNWYVQVDVLDNFFHFCKLQSKVVLSINVKSIKLGHCKLQTLVTQKFQSLLKRSLCFLFIF